ncbi:helix-turn-helix domain-containing protein [Paenibacillus sp. GCM10027626]|uniref:helix-turn-helix domain-containing protein n=1 Tax=Paenibacillus sp. GCM10027626 TaxID=3273411 RepID=UPI0036259A1D
MYRNYFKSKLFLKYFLSYLFILLVPLAIMTVFIYQNAVNNLRSEIEQSRLNQLSQTKAIIDGRMKELSEIASRVSYDQRLTPFRVHDAYYSGEAIQALDQYKATSSIISEMFLYFHKDQNIYSASGMSSLDVFTDRFSFRNWQQENVYRDLNDVKFPTMYPSDLVNRGSHRQETMLAYLVPIKPNSPNPHGTILYLIKEAELMSLIDSILGQYQGTTYILDSKGNVLLDNRQGEKLIINEANLLHGLTDGIHNQRLDGKQLSVVSVTSETNGWTYATVMPTEQFFSSVVHVRSIIILFFSIIVLVGAAIALVLAKMNYQPISTLVDYANTESRPHKSAAGIAKSGNELDHIRTALQDYRSRVDLQEPYARNHLLSMLLKYGNAQHLTPELQEALDVRFDHAHHFVAVVGWGGSEAREDERQELSELFAQIQFPELNAHVYGVELAQLDQLALIISFDLRLEEAPFDHVRRIAEAIRSSMMESFNHTPILGVGTCYPSPDQLNQSFIEACSVFELRASDEPGTISYFEQLSYATDHSYWISSATLMKLSQSLKQGSYDVAAQIISSSIQELNASGLSVLLKRCICFDLLNTMLRAAAELGIHTLTHEVAASMGNNPLNEEIESGLLSLACQICNQVEQINQHEEQSHMDKIVAYIDSHYKDYTLSLETIAVEFALSPSHVSRTFKEKTGTNFTQYIWQKRLDEVLHQLKTTNEPLKDIIIQVGYLDTPSFIRKFKKETGYTPGQYRKLHMENGQADPASDPEEE